MIEIDKTDELYKYLQKLAVDDIDNKYQEYASNGIATIADLKRDLYDKIFSVNAKIDENDLEEILPYYADIRKQKMIPKNKIKSSLIEYKKSKNSLIYEQIVNTYLNQIIYMAHIFVSKYEKLNILDMIQVGNIGLLEAVEKFNEKTKIPFDDYFNYYVLDSFTKEYLKEKLEWKE